MPGDSISPSASIVSAPLSLMSPMAAMRPSLTARSARLGSLPRPSTMVAPRMTRSTITTSVRSERAVGGERRVIDQVADRGAHLHDLHRLRQAVDHRADHRDAAQPLHQARGNVRRVQARHDQHVGRAGEAAERIGLAQQLVVERHVGLHLAVILEVDLLGVEQADRLADAVDALDLAAAEVREGEERHARLVAHGAGVARHLLGDGGELLGRSASR